MEKLNLKNLRQKLNLTMLVSITKKKNKFSITTGLIISSIAVFTGSCSIWEQLGKGPSQQELAGFSRSPHFNKEQQVFENRRPDILDLMNERIDWRMTFEYFMSDSSRRVPDKPLPEVNPPDLKTFLKPFKTF